MSIDQIVRTTLQEQARHAPPGVGLLAGVEVHARRHRRTRYATAAAAVAAVATVAGFVAPSLLPGGSGPGTLATPAGLTEAEYVFPSFPVSPQWTPEDVGEPYVTYFEGKLALAHPAPEPGAPLPLETVAWSAEPAGDDLGNLVRDADPRQVSVTSDQEGTLYEGRHGPVLVFRNATGHWLSVSGSADLGITDADVQRYAAELAATPKPAAPPFAFDTLPDGAELDYLDPAQLGFTLPADGRLSIMVSDVEVVGDRPAGHDPSTSDPDTGPSSSSTPEVPPSRIEIGDRPAELQLDPDGEGASIRMLHDEGRLLTIYATLEVPQLIAFAEGVTITSAAEPPLTNG